MNQGNSNKVRQIDWQGHRGCRGLLPENTIPAFIKAIDLNVNTLEMDVCVSKDKKIIVSHEPWISSAICSPINANVELNEGNEKDFKLMELTAIEIRDFDCGSKGNPSFPQQEKIKTYKPTLTELFSSCEKYIRANNKQLVKYNIEVKSYKDWYNVFIPEPKEFVDLLMNEIKYSGVNKNRFCIQSFDLDILRIMHQEYPEFTLALLIEESKDVEMNIKELGFTPNIYSPYFRLLNNESISICKKIGMKIIPWTVNEIEDMNYLIELGVDGIITDYPDRMSEVNKN